MTRSRQKRGPSLFRRLAYFAILLVSGGSAGGYAFQDHPFVQSLLSLVSSTSVDGTYGKLDGSLVHEVVDVLRPADSFSQPGLFQVTITRVALDQKLFKPGHTVDIRARVQKLNPGGRETTVWDSKSFGSRLAVVGQDDLTAGWPRRPFQVEWTPGDQFALEVYDARPGLFIQPRRLTMDRADSAASAFPLRSGDLPLRAAQASDGPVNPLTNHVVLQSRRLGDLQSSASSPMQIAERPIVIK